MIQVNRENITACPLDCYDACIVEYKDGKLKGTTRGYTGGFLCPHLNHYDVREKIVSAQYNGVEIPLNEAIEKLIKILKTSNKTLHYRGNGNFALMQSVTDHFFTQIDATLTDGTLCDGAGEAGIIQGRGYNDNISPKQIKQSEVVIFWGRNPHTTSSHLLPLIKGKKIIVIDPVKTQIASHADLHVQIKPHGDLKLAMLLARFLHIEGSVDKEFVCKFAPEYEEYYELTQTIRIKAALDEIDVTLGQIGDILRMIKDKKTVIVCGIGIQKYLDGADVMRAIDAFAVFLGLFGKEGCGVGYLGDSKKGLESPFAKPHKVVSKVDTAFSKFDTVFIQGTNPLNQMPNTLRVQNELKKVKNIIYFGLEKNETSAVANLIIPAKTFLQKNDIRASYSDNYLAPMPKQIETDVGISEYDLTKALCKVFDVEIEREEFYLNHFKSYCYEDKEGLLRKIHLQEVPYKNGFKDEFEFLQETDFDFDMKNDYFLLTCKSPRSLNSQFKTEQYVYLHPSLGFKDGQKVKISSKEGDVCLHVKYDERLRADCILIYSGTHGINKLTSSQRSYDANSAVYQQNKVQITLLF